MGILRYSIFGTAAVDNAFLRCILSSNINTEIYKDNPKINVTNHKGNLDLHCKYQFIYKILVANKEHVLLRHEISLNVICENEQISKCDFCNNFLWL